MGDGGSTCPGLENSPAWMRCFTTSVGTRTSDAAHPASAADARNAVCGLYSAARARFAGSYTAMKIAVAGATPSRLPLHHMCQCMTPACIVADMDAVGMASAVVCCGAGPAAQGWWAASVAACACMRGRGAGCVSMHAGEVCGGITVMHRCAAKQVDGGLATVT